MKALLHFLMHTDIHDLVLVWVTDSLAAAWSVNKGRCHEELGLITLTAILTLCDDKKIILVALWVPREHNEYADYLSHLAVYLNRSEVRGTTRAGAHGSSRGESEGQEEQRGSR